MFKSEGHPGAAFHSRQFRYFVAESLQSSPANPHGALNRPTIVFCKPICDVLSLMSQTVINSFSTLNSSSITSVNYAS